MPTNRWDHLEHLLEQALQLPVDERAAWLEQLANDDADLHAELVSLIDAYDGAPTFFDQMAHDVVEATTHASSPPKAGKRIGPYHLLEEIGRGGMGRVFLAERADVGNRVALKLVRGGLAAPETVQRFLFERKVLARLNHPHIARLLDAGVTDDETPFFAMEYVQGESLTHYCDRKRLSVDQRLDLFMQVTQAVQYAHRNLVVHRDLKPSNILVTDEGTVKLLDFGIAKLLEGPDTETPGTPLTRTGMRVLTPEYAAPEQVNGEAVTTATDVYALGVVLYELLTGRRPYQVRGTDRAWEDVICNVEPQKPSTVVTQTTDETKPSTVSEARSTQTERLRQRLSGDLDTICLKALRKEPERRYASAEAFVEDIKRHLAGLPVEARAATASYRLRKFVQRNRGAVLATSLVILALAAGLGVALWQAVEARQAQAQAEEALAESEEAQAFLVELFNLNNPLSTEEVRGDTVTARTILRQGAQRIAEELSDQPKIQGALLNQIGLVNLNLGLYDEADSLLNAALALRREALGNEHPSVAETLNNLGSMHREQGDFEHALDLHQQALAIRRAALPAAHEDVAMSLNNIGLTLDNLGRFEEAETHLREALAIFQQVFGEDHEHTALTHGNLAGALRRQGKSEEAEVEYQAAATHSRNVLGDKHPLYAQALNNFGVFLNNEGKYAQAEQQYREALAIYEELVPEDHPHPALLMNNLGRSLQEQSKLDEAEAFFQESLVRLEGIFGDHVNIAHIRSNVAYVQYERENYEAAEASYQRVLADYRRHLGDDHPYVAEALTNLGAVYNGQDKWDEALASHQEALTIREAKLGADHPDVALTFSNIGSVYHDRGNCAAATPYFERALAIARDKHPERHPRTALYMSNLGGCLTALERFDEAEPLLTSSYDIYLELHEPTYYLTEQTRERLVTLYEQWDKPDEAARYQDGT